MDNLVKENILITIGRAKFYSALFSTFYSIYKEEKVAEESIEALKFFLPEIEEDINQITSEEVKNFRGYQYFDGLLKEVYPKIIEEFYLNYGFEIEELPPDHIITQLAFMSKLVSDELRYRQHGDMDTALKLKIIQHRLLATHMLKLLKGIERLKNIYELIKFDRGLLFMELKDEIGNTGAS